MPIKPTRLLPHWPLAALTALGAALAVPAAAQTDDSTPFYAGGSLGVSHLSNVFRESTAQKGDTVVSTGVLAGVDQRLGRQHLTFDGALQDNRYSSNRELNNQSYTLRGALALQTVGDLSGRLSAMSSRSLADFNIGGVGPIFKKNTERNDEYSALVRLGGVSRYSLEAGWSHRRRDFSASEYDRFVYNQDTGSFGAYAVPGASVRLGLVGRHAKGKYPRYPIYGKLFPNLPNSPIVQTGVTTDDFTRNDFDFTTNWTTGGSSTLNTRVSRTRMRHSLTVLNDFSATTGSVGWNWRPTGKIQLGVQYARDTGQETIGRAVDVNRLYTSWQFNGSYALTGKVSLNANMARNRGRRGGDTSIQLAESFDNDQSYGLGLRWAFSRSLSLSCQYNHASRDSSSSLYSYTTSSYGCTGQALVF